MKAILKKAANALGYQIGPIGRWSNSVDDYYPIDPKPRWGSSGHSQLTTILERGFPQYSALLGSFHAHKQAFKEIPFTSDKPPYWDNEWFQSFDAACLLGFLLTKRPKRYIEIGSGFSTAFAHHGGASITSIDPEPRVAIGALCKHLIRAPLESCDLSIFDELESGDVLFFDGSHRVLQNSDVTVFFLDVLPRLKPGVLVHIHDIFLPADYPQSWTGKLYSEQYMLAAMLLSNPSFRVVLPNYFVCTRMQQEVLELFSYTSTGIMPGALFRGADKVVGSSFWIEVG